MAELVFFNALSVELTGVAVPEVRLGNSDAARVLLRKAEQCDKTEPPGRDALSRFSGSSSNF